MPPRSNSRICERSLDLTLIGIGQRAIPQCSQKHFFMEAFYRMFQAVKVLGSRWMPLGKQQASSRRSFRGGWGQRAWKDQSRSLGDPTGRERERPTPGGNTRSEEHTSELQ